MIDKKILYNAYNNVPYYNYVYNLNNIDIDNVKSMTDLTMLSKETIKKYGILNFINKNYLEDNLKIKNEQNIIMIASSGTTGEPMNTIWCKKDYLASTFSHWKYRLKKFSITPSDTFFTSSRLKNEERCCIQQNYREYIINTNNINNENICKILELLNNVKPKWLLIQPSVLYALINYLNIHNMKLPTSIKYIEYFSEVLLPFYKKKIEEVINCPSTNMYGCTEVNGIAYECSQGNLHILDDNVNVEIVNKNIISNVGNVCVTSLHNSVMPIIRYMLNDKAKVVNEKCKCGNKSLIIKLINARIPEFLICNDLNYCNIGEIYFPIQRLKVIDQRQNDIVFFLKKTSMESYKIIFYNKTCLSLSKRKLYNKFLTIIKTYGLDNCKFVVDFTNKEDPRLLKGILRLNDSKDT